MNDLTERQSEVLAFIANASAQKGSPPTVVEIAEHFGWSSQNSAKVHIDALIRKGWLLRDRGKNRSIRQAKHVSGFDDAALWQVFSKVVAQVL